MHSLMFLTIDEVLAIHRAQINLFGGTHGIRDINLLESAVLSPQATFAGEFLYQDVFQMAAAYLYGINSNHPFLDGNKRTATICGFIFLEYNGYILKEGVDLYEISMATARGETSIDSLSIFLRDNTIAVTS